MHTKDILFYYRSQDDDSGVVMKRSRIKLSETPAVIQDESQLTLPLNQTPV